MIKRWFLPLLPGLLVVLELILLAGPGEWRSVSGELFVQWEFLLIWGPPILIVITVLLAVYFHSSRITWYGITLFGLYGYLLHAPLGIPMMESIVGPSTRGFNQSLMLFPYLLPLQFLLIHKFVRRDPLTLTGAMIGIVILGEFAALGLLFHVVGGPLAEALGATNALAFTVDSVQIPIVSLTLLIVLGLILWWDTERSYYENGKVLLFWTATATTVPYLRGLEWYVGSDPLIPLHLYLGMGTGSIFLVGWILNYTWSKAYRDQLTQLQGRMALDEKLERLNPPYVLAMIDIDEFKSFNDTFGHDAGDKVLIRVAETLETHTSGVAYRFGGEEFTIVFPGEDLESVEDELEAVRKAVADTRVEVTRKSQRATKIHKKRVTISIGAAEPTGDTSTAEKVLNRADEAMFKAKDEGRNQCVIASS